VDFLQRIGNFFSGGGFTSDAERKKKDEEEARRQAEAAAQRAANAKQQTQAPRTVGNPGLNLNIPGTTQNPMLGLGSLMMPTQSRENTLVARDVQTSAKKEDQPKKVEQKKTVAEPRALPSNQEIMNSSPIRTDMLMFNPGSKRTFADDQRYNQAVDNRRRELKQAANQAEQEDLSMNLDYKRYNQMSAEEQQKQRRAILAARDKTAPTSKENIDAINTWNEFLANVDGNAAEDGTADQGETKKSVKTVLNDLLYGTEDMLKESDLKALTNAFSKIGADVGGEGVGQLQTQQQVDELNAAYAAGLVDYDTVVRAFRASPALYNANFDWQVSEDGGITNIKDDIGARTGKFAGGTVNAGSTAAQFLPYGAASKAPSALARFGSRFMQGGVLNAGFSVAGDTTNTAIDRTGEEIGQNAALSFLLGGAIEGAFGVKGGPDIDVPAERAAIRQGVQEADNVVTEAATNVRIAEQELESVPETVSIGEGTGIKSTNAASDAKAAAELKLVQAQQAQAQAEATAKAAREAAAREEARLAKAEQAKAQAAEAEARIQEERAIQEAQAISEEAEAAAKQAEAQVDEAAVQPAVAPETPEATVAETTTTAKSKEAAAAATPVTPEVPTNKNVAAADGRVKAAQERLDYLKREMAEPSEIKKAEAELRAAKNDAKETQAAESNNAPQTTPAEAKAATEAPEGYTKVQMNKNGTVNRTWMRKEIEKITKNESLSREEKAAAIRALDERVKKIESDNVMAKQADKDKYDEQLTADQKAGRAETAPIAKEVKEVKKAERAKAKTVAEAQGTPIKAAKGKAGGKVSTYMDRVSKTFGNEGVKEFFSAAPGKRKVSFKDVQEKATKEAAEASTKQAIANAKALAGNTGEATVEVEARALAHQSRIAEELADLVNKKGKTAAEKKLIKQLGEAKLDLEESIAIRASESGRSTAYLGYIYQSMDPTMVARRVKKRLEDAGGQMNDVEEAAIIQGSKDLKKVYESNDALKTEVTTAQEKLTKKSPKRDFKRLEKATKELEASNKELADAFYKVNETVDGIRVRNIDEGIVTEQKWYGRKLDNYTRAAMLSAPSGRVRDIITTNMLTQNDVKLVDAMEAIIGRGLNNAMGRQVFKQKATAGKGVVRKGYQEAGERIAAAWRGDADKPLMFTGLASGSGKTVGSFDPRSGMTLSTGKKSRVYSAIHTAVAAPTYLSRGYKNATLYKEAFDAATKRGLTNAQADIVARSAMVQAPEAIYKSASFKTKEISGLQSKVGEALNRFFQSVEKKINTSELSAPAKKALANSFTVGKNLTIPFSSYMTGTAQNMVTRQSMITQVVKFGKAINAANKAGNKAAKEAELQKALNAFTQGSWNAAKMGAGLTVLAPFLSDEDANGNSYTPPYLKFGDTTVPIGMLGPLGAQLVNAWAVKKAAEGVSNGDNPFEAAAGYTFNLARGLLGATGLASLNTASTPLFGFFNEISSAFNDPDKAGEQGATDIIDLGVDFATQLVPAFLRDVVATMNSFGADADGIAPETNIKDEDGKRDAFKSGLAKIGSAIPIISQSLEGDDEGKAATKIEARIIGATTTSDATRASNAQADAERETVNKSLSKVLGSDKYRDLLTDDQKEIYDKAGDKELKASELEEVRNQIIKSEQKFLDAGDWEAYSNVLNLQRDKITEDPTSAASDTEELDREITRSDLAKSNKIDSYMYKLYDEISNTELEAMLDPESELYDIETAKYLVAIDKLFTENQVSDNTSGEQGWKRAKYKTTTGSGSGSSKKGKGIATTVGTVGSGARTVSAPGLKYRQVSTNNSAFPNLVKRTAQTGLKKKISVQKGVKL